MSVNLDISEGEGRVQESLEITLRPIELSDVDDFMVWAADDKVTRFCLWDTYTSKEQALNYIKNCAIPHPWLRVICIENRAIGAITVTPGSGFDRCRGELGYVLSYNYWGKGIVTRAVQMVASTIFKEWPYLERLQAIVATDNNGSQRVLEKAGFQLEGLLRKYRVIKGKTKDEVMFSLLSTDNFLV
ncbi:Acyl-CoA N-acyltransferase (NAT) superfamily protein [Forsythia ovata]|uniref:Acyl-CoA N-acyltransferase (NAT) superfamily protein n=1 Tax=Forsythia ovata TaxID=205694 RepID=A0ABD1PJ02_9LAMI